MEQLTWSSILRMQISEFLYLTICVMSSKQASWQYSLNDVMQLHSGLYLQMRAEKVPLHSFPVAKNTKNWVWINRRNLFTITELLPNYVADNIQECFPSILFVIFNLTSHCRIVTTIYNKILHCLIILEHNYSILYLHGGKSILQHMENCWAKKWAVTSSKLHSESVISSRLKLFFV